MKLGINARIQKAFDHYGVRIAIGIAFSLLLHGIILSLQLGIAGFGFPGRELSWRNQAEQTPNINIRLSNIAGSPNREPQPLPQLAQDEVVPKPQYALPGKEQPLLDLPNAQVKQTPTLSAEKSLHTANALRSVPAVADAKSQDGAPPLEDSPPPLPAPSQSEVVTSKSDKPGTFTIAPPDLDQPKSVEQTPEANPIPAPVAHKKSAAAIAMATPKKSIDQTQRLDPAVQKPSNEESFQPPEQTQATQSEPAKADEPATEHSKQKQGEDVVAQDMKSEQKETEEIDKKQKQQDAETRQKEEKRQEEENAKKLAEEKLEDERNAKLAKERADKEREDTKQQEQKEAQVKLEAEKQRQQAAERARQEADALALKKQLEETEKQAEDKRKQDKEKADRLTEEQARKKQLQELQQRNAELEKQKQEQIATEQRKAQEIATRKQAEAKALAERENAQLEAQAKAAAGTKPTAVASSGKAVNNETHVPAAEAEALPKGDFSSSMLNLGSQMAKSDVASPTLGNAGLSNKGFLPAMPTKKISDAQVEAYIQWWRTKIEQHYNLNYSQSSAEQALRDPVVTVVIDSDGNIIGDIIIDISSGRRDLDEAVKKILRWNRNYGRFPPGMAQKMTQITIRRIWHFGETLKILEELP